MRVSPIMERLVHCREDRNRAAVILFVDGVELNKGRRDGLQQATSLCQQVACDSSHSLRLCPSSWAMVGQHVQHVVCANAGVKRSGAEPSLSQAHQ
jgi:hypothetical protein